MIQNRVLLSVVVPVYNSERYIERCVNSILKQDYLALEIILVDDGSSDQSGAICDSLAKDNACLKVLHMDNNGVIYARFAGVKAACGDWITFVDADDWIAEDAYKGIFENDCEVIITGICRYYNEKYQLEEMPYLSEGIYDKEKILNEIIPIMLWNPKQGVWALDPSLCTKIFKRNVILSQLKLNFELESHYGDDTCVIFPLMFQVKCIRIVRKIYYYHRQRKSEEIPPYIRDEEFFSKLHKVYEYLKIQFKNTGYWNTMKNQLDYFYINSVELKKKCFEHPIQEMSAYFPLDKIHPKSKVVLYGAGKIGQEYWRQNSLYHFCDIVSWVDMKYESYQLGYYDVKNPELIKSMTFDFIIIAVDNYYIAKEIINYLKELGIEEEKMVWHSVRVAQI